MRIQRTTYLERCILQEMKQWDRRRRITWYNLYAALPSPNGSRWMWFSCVQVPEGTPAESMPIYRRELEASLARVVVPILKSIDRHTRRGRRNP